MIMTAHLCRFGSNDTTSEPETSPLFATAQVLVQIVSDHQATFALQADLQTTKTNMHAAIFLYAVYHVLDVMAHSLALLNVDLDRSLEQINTNQMIGRLSESQYESIVQLHASLLAPNIQNTLTIPINHYSKTMQTIVSRPLYSKILILAQKSHHILVISIFKMNSSMYWKKKESGMSKYDQGKIRNE